MTAIDQTKLDAMMARVQKLLAVADDPATTPEASANYREKAESLMREYRIAEEDLIAQDAFSILPTSKKFTLIERESEFSRSYQAMWYAITYHTGIRSVLRWELDRDTTQYTLVATVVGYASDIRYAEFLWSAARLMFSAKIEPSVDPEASEQENVYRLRSAGIERNRISVMMWGNAYHSNNAKVTRLYVRACGERGEDPAVVGRSISAKDYRKVYARSFVARIGTRLQDARDAADSVGGAIELVGRKERVDETFYTIFPNYRPTPDSEPVAEEACAACKRAKSGHCRKHPAYRATKASLARVDRMYYSETARRAASAGASAADLVKINRTTDRAKRIEESTE